MQISLGLPDPRDQSSLPILKRVQAGICRAAMLKGPSAQIRLPITYRILSKIREELSTSSHSERSVVWAIACTAFFGFFRLGELLPTSEKTFDPKQNVCWEDIAVDSKTKPTMFRLYLKKSKCDQFGKGAHIILGRTSKQVCPVTALTQYAAVRPPSTGPLFITTKGKVITKQWFITQIRSILVKVGIPQDQYAGHSFRIGAATTAAQNGIEDSTIKTLGRWQSAAFLQYIRMPQEHLATLARTLATGK